MEATQQKYEYGCAMLYFNFPTLKILHQAIDPADIYTEDGTRSFGLEVEPHVTLLYGLHDGVTADQVKKIVNRFPYGKCRFYNASLFENDYDVLKFRVEGLNLHTSNKMLKELPHTSTFPNYQPHLTVGYLKQGTGKKYTEMFEHLEFEAMPTYVVYSAADGTKHTLSIELV